MPPKYIILKIQSISFYRLFVKELKKYSKIKFHCQKINGIPSVVIKCQKYYENVLDISLMSNIYFSYIYLYISISLILSQLIIDFYEEKITKQIVSFKYTNLSAYDKKRFINITHAVLDSNYPAINSRKLYLYRKDLIFQKLLLHFKKRNYLYVDFFVYFKLSNYHQHLEEIIEKTYSHY